MTRRTRRRRPKRVSRRTARQERLLLEKEVRERYRPGAAEELDVEEWLVEDPPDGRPGDDSGTRRHADAREGLLIGLWSGGGTLEVDGEDVPAVLASRIARDQRSRIAVGDRVLAVPAPEGPWRVVEVVPRNTSLSRVDPHQAHREHLMAANVDVAVIVASLVRPELRPALIDRYLVVVERGGARALVFVNKVDLASADVRSDAALALRPLGPRGVEVVWGSAQSGRGLEELRARLAGRTAVFVGHSGVGKSSLVRALDPRLDLRIGEVADDGRGRHTTTGSRLHHLAGGIDVIDTPGIRELGLGDLPVYELRVAFPEIAEIGAGCRYPDCSHVHEPECAVRIAVDEGDLASERHEAWVRLVESDG